MSAVTPSFLGIIVGRVSNTDWNDAERPEIEYPNFTVVGLSLGVKFHEHRNVSLKIENLFDEDYYEKKGYPKPGRSFFVSYEIKY